MASSLSKERVEEIRALAFSAKPFPRNSGFYTQLDFWYKNDEERKRLEANMAIRLLEIAGLWTPEDELRAFGEVKK